LYRFFGKLLLRSNLRYPLTSNLQTWTKKGQPGVDKEINRRKINEAKRLGYDF